MTKHFKIPFATQGDRVAVPDERQDDGAISYTQGYGYDYERDQATDPAEKDIEREKINSLFHDITEALGEMQHYGVAQWSSLGKPYPIRAQVYANHRTWQSKIENNNDEPGKSNNWIELKADINPIDILYPVGIVTLFAENKNPNNLFPGTTWKYIGENKTIRLAATDGEDIMTTGGVDSIKLTVDNLPVHSHAFSGETSSFDYGNRKTSINGDHDHNAGIRSSGSWYANAWCGTDNQGNYGARKTSEAGNHEHTVSIGAHNHSISGTTANAGLGVAIGITNSYVKLMGWYRTA